MVLLKKAIFSEKSIRNIYIISYKDFDIKFTEE